MTGELAARRGGPQQPDDGSLVVWAQEARDAHQIAESLARTSFVPKAMQGRPEEVTAAILTGRELGLEPMAALRSINVIEGTPAMTAHAMRGLAQSLGHQVWVEESTDSRAIVCGRRHGDQTIERVTWTIDRAKKAGLVGKSNWMKHPAAMLVARATAEVVRRIAADALMGMPYATEELTDDGTVPPTPAGTSATPTTGAKPKPRTLKRAAPPAAPASLEEQQPEPEPAAQPDPLDEPAATIEPEPVVVEPEPEPEPQPELMTERQKRALMAVYKRTAGDRDTRIAHASETLGRDILSFNDLTKHEAMILLDALTSEPDDGDEL